MESYIMNKSLYSKSLKLVLLSVLLLQASSQVFAMENGKRKAADQGDSEYRESKRTRGDTFTDSDPEADEDNVVADPKDPFEDPFQTMQIVANNSEEAANAAAVNMNQPGEDELQIAALTYKALINDQFGDTFTDSDPEADEDNVVADPKDPFEDLFQPMQIVANNSEEAAKNVGEASLEGIQQQSRDYLALINDQFKELIKSFSKPSGFHCIKPKTITNGFDKKMTLLQILITKTSSKSNLELIKACLEKYHEMLNAPDNDGWTPLHYVAAAHTSKKSVEVMGQWYESKVNNIASASDIMRILLGVGADPNITDKEGHNPLFYAKACATNANKRIKLLEAAMNGIESGTAIQNTTKATITTTTTTTDNN
jgi:hypothetical protein